MRIMPKPAATAVKSVHTQRDWRPLTTGETVVAVVVDVLLLIVVVLVPLLALNVRALPWILLAQVIVVQSLVLARFGRTVGLATVSATVVVPQQGAAPGIGRASARVLLPFLLPFQVGPRTSSGQQDEDRERLLDRLTGTLTVTRRPMPEQVHRHPARKTRTKTRRAKRGSKPVVPSPVAPEVMTRRRVRNGGKQPSTGSVAAGAPMFHPPAPPMRERPDLAGPIHAGTPAGTGTSVDPAPVAVPDSGVGRSRFAPPAHSPAPPPPTAPSPVAPAPPPASLPQSSAPATTGSSPTTPSVFAASSGPPTSSMPVRPSSAAPSAPSSAPIPSVPVEAEAPLPPSLPPRIQPGRHQASPPPPPSGRHAAPQASGTPAAVPGARSGDLDAPGGPVGPQHAQPPVIPPSSVASSSSQRHSAAPPASGRPDSSSPSGPPSVPPSVRRPKAI